MRRRTPPAVADQKRRLSAHTSPKEFGIARVDVARYSAAHSSGGGPRSIPGNPGPLINPHGRRPMPPSEYRRPIALSDGLIVIAGFAVGLALLKAAIPKDLSIAQFCNAIISPSDGWSPWHAYALTLELGTFFAIPFLAGWTPACLVLQLTGPRPPWRRLRRQPGLVACLIVTAVVLAATMIVVMLAACGISQLPSSDDDFLKPFVLGGAVAGAGVLSSWATMRLYGACRPTTVWTDRLGRLTGMIWIGLGAISVCYLGLAMN